MAEKTLTAAILGLGKAGQDLLGAVQATNDFRIKAVADQDQQQVERVARDLECEPYTDYRQLIVQNQLDCLLVASDIHLCDEHLKTALKKHFHVLKLAPPARDFEETLEYVRLAEAENAHFAIANPARFRSSYQKAHALLAEEQVRQIFLITAHCNIGDRDRPTWYTDPKLAGGGVLLHDCHQIIDQILWSFPIPQQVYALTTNQAPDKQQRLYLTEDTAVVSMKFTDAVMGNIVATRCSDPGTNEMWLRIYGRDAVLTVDDRQVTVRSTADGKDQTWEFEESEQDAKVRLLSSFAQSVRTPDEKPLLSSGAENLANMAVFESAYLSARTGFPEEPARILRLTGNPSGAVTSI
ncbi:MAG: Gfo/Idh/MocA family oxidoreductase [Phycisphaerales bacterium]|nr:MAG: Gfo/Idh/MocA family oxidoreductase [Phycisphaerales bacterium]